MITSSQRTTFESLNLIHPLQKALRHEGYEIPTAIQAETIPPALAGRDILGCAQTGTGKTAAFALPILNALAEQDSRPYPKQPQALVLAPTRELAIQIGDSFQAYGRHTRVRQAIVFGGVSQHRQVESLKSGVHLVVATPGRLLDLMSQGHIDLSHLEYFVLDEADRMMDMGFLPDLKRIIRCLPDQRQSLFFSATLPPDIVDLSQRLLADPVTVNVTPKRRSVATIRQDVLLVQKPEKFPLLEKILLDDKVDQAIVFTRTKRAANLLERKLNDRGFSAAAIHGNKSQNSRQRVLQSYRDNRLQILVATDLAARGIDVDGVTHVINYDVPNEPESYVHRIGRTGRAGAHGSAVTFVTPDQRKELQAIERLIGKKLLNSDLMEDAPKSERRGGKSDRQRSEGSKRTFSRRRTSASKSMGNVTNSQPNATQASKRSTGEAPTANPKQRQAKRSGFRSRSNRPRPAGKDSRGGMTTSA